MMTFHLHVYVLVMYSIGRLFCLQILSYDWSLPMLRSFYNNVTFPADFWHLQNRRWSDGRIAFNFKTFLDANYARYVRPFLLLSDFSLLLHLFLSFSVFSSLSPHLFLSFYIVFTLFPHLFLSFSFCLINMSINILCDRSEGLPNGIVHTIHLINNQQFH